MDNTNEHDITKKMLYVIRDLQKTSINENEEPINQNNDNMGGVDLKEVDENKYNELYNSFKELLPSSNFNNVVVFPDDEIKDIIIEGEIIRLNAKFTFKLYEDEDIKPIDDNKPFNLISEKNAELMRKLRGWVENFQNENWDDVFNAAKNKLKMGN